MPRQNGRVNSPTFESLLTRISNSVEDYAFQIETKENEMTNICAEKNEILFGADGTLERTEKLIAEKQETEERIEKPRGRERRFLPVFPTQTGKEEIYSERLNSRWDGKYQLEIKNRKNETQLDTLKEKLWEEFEVSYAQAEDLRKLTLQWDLLSRKAEKSEEGSEIWAKSMLVRLKSTNL